MKAMKKMPNEKSLCKQNETRNRMLDGLIVRVGYINLLKFSLGLLYITDEYLIGKKVSWVSFKISYNWVQDLIILMGCPPLLTIVHKANDILPQEQRQHN